jgi:hypothetical protein
MRSATARLLASLDSISAETVQILDALESPGIDPADRREAKRRVLEIRARAHELIEWLSEARLEAPKN